MSPTGSSPKQPTRAGRAGSRAGGASSQEADGYVIRLLLANLQGISLRDPGAKSPTGDNTAVSLLDGASDSWGDRWRWRWPGCGRGRWRTPRRCGYPQAGFGSRMDRWSIPGAETPAEVLARVKAAVEDIARANPGKTLALFSQMR